MYRSILLAMVFAITCVFLSACPEQAEGTSKESVLVTKPETVESQGRDVESCPTIGFSGYQDYFSFFQLSTTQPLSTEMDMLMEDGAIAYSQMVKEDPGILMIPYYADKPVALREKEGYAAISILQKELYGFLWTWFHTYVEGENVTIRLSKLSEQDSKLASEMSCSEFIAAIAPTAPNVSNYQEKDNYRLVFEDEASVGGVETSMLVKQTKNEEEYITFAVDGYLVVICAPIHTVTKAWLQEFRLESLAG